MVADVRTKAVMKKSGDQSRMRLESLFGISKTVELMRTMRLGSSQKPYYWQASESWDHGMLVSQ